MEADALAAALQDGPVLLGLPWFNAWFTPGRDGFVDAVPYWRTSGLAGGHEVCAIGLEDVAQYPDGRVIPERTVLRLRATPGAGAGATTATSSCACPPTSRCAIVRSQAPLPRDSDLSPEPGEPPAPGRMPDPRIANLGDPVVPSKTPRVF